MVNVIMGDFLGVFLGHSIYSYFDYKLHPGLYQMQSAPWYSSTQVYGLVTAIVIAAGLIVRFIIVKRLENG